MKTHQQNTPVDTEAETLRSDAAASSTAREQRFLNEIAELRILLDEAAKEMEWAQKFIGWRERMHPDGQRIYAETIRRIREVQPRRRETRDYA